MEEVADMLASHGIYHAWVGASDQNGDDMVKWPTTDELLHMSFWMTDEPNQPNGDCVYLNVIAKGLGMSNCDSPKYYVCKWL